MRIIAAIALRNLFAAKRRTGLLSAAIGLVTTMLVLLLAIGAGIEDNLVNAATMLGGGHVTVSGFYKTQPDVSAPMLQDAASVRKVVEESVPELDYMVARDRGWGKIISANGSMQSAISGLVVEEEHRLLDSLQIIDGSLEEFGQPNTVVIFASHARTLNVGPGETLTFQSDPADGFVNTLDVRVVAVARDVGMLSSFTVYTPRQTVLELGQLNPGTTGAFWVYIDDIDQSTAVMDRLRTAFADSGFPVMDHVSAPFFFKFDTVNGEDWVGQQIDLTIWRDEVSFLTWVITAFNTVTWFLVLILVSIIGVGIMNALWSSVRERTKEIGTMRAIGTTRTRVLFMVLFEAFFLGLFATTLGAVVGTVIAVAINAARIPVPSEAMQSILLSDYVTFSVRPMAVLSAIVLLTLFTAIAAILPARRAAKLPPITAIQLVQ